MSLYSYLDSEEIDKFSPKLKIGVANLVVLRYLGSMLLKIFNRTSHCKATNDFMQKNMLCVIFFFDLWRNGFRNLYFLTASIENYSFDLLIHEIKILPRPGTKAWGLAEKEWPSPPTYQPPHQLTNLDGTLLFCRHVFWWLKFASGRCVLCLYEGR